MIFPFNCSSILKQVEERDLTAYNINTNSDASNGKVLKRLTINPSLNPKVAHISLPATVNPSFLPLVFIFSLLITTSAYAVNEISGNVSLSDSNDEPMNITLEHPPSTSHSASLTDTLSSSALALTLNDDAVSKLSDEATDSETNSLVNSNTSDSIDSNKSTSNVSSGAFDLHKATLTHSNSTFQSNITNINSTVNNNYSNDTSNTLFNLCARMSNFDWFDLDINFHSVTSFFASGAIIFGGMVPYIPQYLEIQKTKNSSGFSTYVCLNLIAANTLRIIFWFGKRFEIPLLVQSVIMIITMFIMMEICLRMRKRVSSTSATPSKSKAFFGKFGKELNSLSTSNADCPASNNFADYSYTTLSTDPSDSSNSSSSSSTPSTSPPCLPSPIKLDLNPRHFWQWSDLMSYIECTILFAVIIGLLMYLLISNTIFVETVGYASLLTESCLAVPQLIKNHTSKSTLGMSKTMVLLWAAGDLFKTSYFIVKNVPLQFIVCGVIQVTVDVLILIQVSIYSRQRTEGRDYRT